MCLTSITQNTKDKLLYSLGRRNTTKLDEYSDMLLYLQCSNTPEIQKCEVSLLLIFRQQVGLEQIVQVPNISFRSMQDPEAFHCQREWSTIKPTSAVIVKLSTPLMHSLSTCARCSVIFARISTDCRRSSGYKLSVSTASDNTSCRYNMIWRTCSRYTSPLSITSGSSVTCQNAQIL